MDSTEKYKNTHTDTHTHTHRTQPIKIVGIIQARLGSSRLPYKMMLSLHGRPIIEWVVRRVSKARLLNEIVVATSVKKENDILAEYVRRLGFKVFRGSEEDVLDRFVQAASTVQATHVVRICADNPLIAPAEIDHLIQFYLDNKCDYAYNHIPLNNTYPDGLGAEIVSYKLLESLSKKAVLKEHREHIFLYIHDNREKFEIRTFDPPDKSIANPQLKFDIDTFDDYYYLSQKYFDLDITAQELVKLFGVGKMCECECGCECGKEYIHTQTTHTYTDTECAGDSHATKRYI